MRPGYFEPGTAISFCAADCADGGCCARAAPATVITVAAIVATVAGRKNRMHRPRVFCSRGENDSNFRATLPVSGDWPNRYRVLEGVAWPPPRRKPNWERTNRQP